MLKRSILFLILLLISFTFISAGQLQVTEEHPFLVNGSWISASDLKVGDILTTSDGKNVTIKKITDIGQKTKVYNLEAGIFHNFVVGDENVVVHNSNRPYGGSTPPVLSEHLPPKEFTVVNNPPVVSAANEQRLLSLAKTPEETAVLQYLIDAFKASQVTMEDFVQGMILAVRGKGGVADLIGSNKYAVIAGIDAPRKSYYWAWKIAEPSLVETLGKKPEGEIFWDKMEAMGQIDRVLQQKIRQGVRSFVIFDDISYSGQQMRINLKEIKDSLNKAALTLGVPPSEIQVIAGVPFTSVQARKNLAPTNIGAGIFVSSSQLIKNTVYNPYSHSSPSATNEFWLTLDEKSTLDSIFLREGYDHFTEGSTLTWASFKIPDGLSLSQSLAYEKSPVKLFKVGEDAWEGVPYKTRDVIINAEKSARENFVNSINLLPPATPPKLVPQVLNTNVLKNSPKPVPDELDSAKTVKVLIDSYGDFIVVPLVQ